MASFDRGTKRQCQHCGSKFYDLNRDPIICPSCGEQFLIEATRPAPKEEAAKEVAESEDVSTTEEVVVDTAAADAGAEVISLSDAEDEEADDEEIPDVEDVEVDDELSADEEDAFLEEDDDDDDEIGLDIPIKSDD